MRIVSDFKDYYDGLMQHDEERDTVFVRNTEKPEVIKFDLPRPSGGYSGFFVIYFCGKYYPITRIVDRSPKPPYGIDKETLIYGKENYLNYRAQIKQNNGKKVSHKIADLFGWDWTTQEKLFDFFEKPDPSLKSLEERFGPIFGIYPDGYESGVQWGEIAVKRNINLGRYGFYKMIHPGIAYNELLKAVYNMQRPSRPIPEMANDIKIHQAGFDPKTSFRKAKAEKK